MQNLVSVEWLHENLENRDLILLDCSMTKAADGKVSKLKDLTIPSA